MVTFPESHSGSTNKRKVKFRFKVIGVCKRRPVVIGTWKSTEIQGMWPQGHLTRSLTGAGRDSWEVGVQSPSAIKGKDKFASPLYVKAYMGLSFLAISPVYISAGGTGWCLKPSHRVRYVLACIEYMTWPSAEYHKASGRQGPTGEQNGKGEQTNGAVCITKSHEELFPIIRTRSVSVQHQTLPNGVL